MITEHVYETLDREVWEKKIEECCDKENQDDPKGCDCCYDTWINELKEVKTKYSEAEEQARQVAAELAFVSDRRNKLKNWYDELTKANDLSRQLCDQIEVFIDQIEKVSVNTKLAVKAIRILYCMIRDFYMQVDLIKEKYEYLQNCIRCLNDPALAPGKGIVKCLEEFGQKLEILIATRDELIKMLMAAIYQAYRIRKNIGKDYGLLTVVTEWRTALHCEESCTDAEETPNQSSAKNQPTAKTKPVEKEPCDDDDPNDPCKDQLCNLEPILHFPICKDPYYKETGDKYTRDKACAEKLAKELVDLNKKKESLLSCKVSLEAAIKEVDPKTRCK